MRLRQKRGRRGTLKMLVLRAFKVCTKDHLLEMELCHLETTFVEVNNLPRSVVKRIISQIRKDINTPTNLTNNSADQIAVEEKIIQCTLSYAGEKGELIVKEVNKQFKKVKKHNLKAHFAFKAKRLSLHFNLKDPIKKEHLHNVVYEIECPDCDMRYFSETGRRIHKQFKEHTGRDHNSHFLKHTLEEGHSVSFSNLKVLNSNYANYSKRKVSEALYIKQKKTRHLCTSETP